MADKELSLHGHLAELRKRLTISAAALVAGAGVAFAFHRMIFDVLMIPAQGFESLRDQKLIFTHVTEMIGITMKVSLMGGFVLAFPVILYQIFSFVAPGLTAREKRFLYALFPGAILSFAAGAAFSYFALLPPALNFLLWFGTDIATPMIRIGDYMNKVITLIFWMGVAFETPLVIFFLSKIGLVTPRSLARQRRFAVVVAFIVGALATTTIDPLNQSLVALTIMLLYEVGILLAKLARRGSKSSVDIATSEPSGAEPS